jgi:two-component sensor histidine kinase
VNAANEPKLPGSIRSRLLLALAIALAPVLVLGASQTISVYSRDLELRRISLVDAAERSASMARTRVEGGQELLQTLSAQTVGLQCSQNLRAIVGRLKGYENLIRFDRIGRVSCASGDAAENPERRKEAWFTRLEAGDTLVVTQAPAGLAKAPALLAAVRAEQSGVFDGAMVAVIDIDALRPDARDPAVARGSEVALADRDGNFVSYTRASAFPASFKKQMGHIPQGGAVFESRDRTDRRRLLAAAPLVSNALYVVISAPAQTVREWSRPTNLLSTIAPPVLAFLLAVVAVWFVADRVVVRWLHYIQRIAEIYAKGRFTVRAVKASEAPPEIAELAATLESMADAILERDASLQESLAEKDRLMREIHHRVKNNLQVMSSMVSMQQRAITDPVMRETLDDIRQRIAALALIYRTLYQGPNLRQVDLKTFLEDLTAQMVMSESARGHAVDTALTADHLSVDPDRLAPLALFAVEAITNAHKHAFHGRGGTLRIAFHGSGDKATLEIADSGGEGDPAGAVERLKKGVGGILMTAFARQLGGSVTFSPNEGGGLTALLTFPLPDPAAETGNLPPA